jgi:hypothetical protein
MVSDEQLEMAMDFIRDRAKDYAKAKAARVQLTEFRKSKKAMLMRNAEIAGHKTVAAQEREAYADDEYVELLNAIKDATEQEELLRYQMKGAELKIDIWRTRAANQRAERQRYGA